MPISFIVFNTNKTRAEPHDFFRPAERINQIKTVFEKSWNFT